MEIPTEQSVRITHEIPSECTFLGFLIHNYDTDESLAEYQNSGRCWSRTPEISLRLNDTRNMQLVYVMSLNLIQILSKLLQHLILRIKLLFQN